MVNRRDLMQAILGAGASLVAMVIGTKAESREVGGIVSARPEKSVTGIGDGMRFENCSIDLSPRVEIWGGGEAFYELVESWKCRGWRVETGAEWSHFDPKWMYCVRMRASIAANFAERGIAMREGGFGRGFRAYHWTDFESLAAKGVAAISVPGLSIDLT